MTACRAEARRARAPALLALALGAALAWPAAAQQGPIRLTPPRLGEPAQPPAAPPAAAAGGAGIATEPAAPPAPDAITVAPTAPVSAESVGVIDEAKGGLPAGLWAGSTQARVARLVALLPEAGLSPAARALTRRTLASAGPPPARGADAGAASFVGLRAQRLFAMGLVEDAAALALLVPGRDEDEALTRVLFDAALVHSNAAEACALARRAVARFGTLHWQKALIFCQATAGDHTRAQLGLSMLREMKADDDEAFVRLVLALGGDKRPIPELPAAPTPLHLAMLRAAARPVPAAAVERASPPVLRMIAQSPSAGAETRLAAAMRAEAAGALPGEALVQILEATPFSAEETKDLLGLAEKAPAPRALAAVYRAAKAQSVAVARAEALARGWRIAGARGFHAAAARVTADLVAGLPRAPELGWFAPEATRALLAAGRSDDAKPWYALARDEAPRAGAAPAHVLTGPLMRLAGLSPDVPNRATLTAWLAAQKAEPKRARERLALLIALLEALGDGTDGSLSGLLLDGELEPEEVRVPPAALWLGRDGAASAGRIGESALFVLAAFGPEGPRGWSPHTLVGQLQALRAVGLEAEARALAVEAAIAAGL